MRNIYEIVSQSIEKSNMDELKSLSLSKEDLISQDPSGMNIVMIAASQGSIKTLKYLVAYADRILGYDVYKIFSARDHFGLTAISLAATNNHTDTLVKLYELGAYDSLTANQQDWHAFANMVIDADLDKDKIAYKLKSDAKHKLEQIYNKDLYSLVIDSQSSQKEILGAIETVGNVNAKIYDEQPAL